MFSLTVKYNRWSRSVLPYSSMLKLLSVCGEVFLWPGPYFCPPAWLQTGSYSADCLSVPLWRCSSEEVPHILVLCICTVTERLPYFRHKTGSIHPPEQQPGKHTEFKFLHSNMWSESTTYTIVKAGPAVTVLLASATITVLVRRSYALSAKEDMTRGEKKTLINAYNSCPTP